MPCRHPDVRKFDGVRCCLACGEAVFEHAPAIQTTHTTAQSQYQYNDLNSRLGQEIRITVLLPGGKTDPIICNIIHVNLADGPNFEAVSYTWATEYGDDSKTGVVYLANGAKIPVTANCEAVLRQLRLPGYERRLWLDALCINQINVHERNHQVSLMDQIYHGAKNVLVSIPELRSEWTNGAVSYNGLRRLFAWLHGDGSDAKDVELATLRFILEARYFQRVWTIQEVALAKNVILCVKGESVELSFLVLDRVRSIQKVPAALRWNPGLARDTDVLSCLRAGIESQCKDARDKVYAVLSLMEPQARSFIPVDYSLELDAIYTNALLAVMAAHGCLEVLTYALVEHPRLVSGNQDIRTVTLALFEMYISSDRPIIHKGGPALSAQWEDTATSIWQPKITVRTTPILDTYVDECSDPDQSIVVFERRCSVASGCLLPRFQIRAHFIDVIRWHQQQHEGPILTSLGNDLRLQNCSRFFPFFSRTPHPQTPFFELESGLHPHDKVNEHNTPGINVPDLHTFMKTLRNTDEDRKLFTTHYSIGHARGGICNGDAVYVLDGARFPFVLRKVGPMEYTIVTVCYLWAALELDYWNPGSRKGLWGSRHHVHACEQAQTIVIH